MYGSESQLFQRTSLRSNCSIGSTFSTAFSERKSEKLAISSLWLLLHRLKLDRGSATSLSEQLARNIVTTQSVSSLSIPPCCLSKCLRQPVG